MKLKNVIRDHAIPREKTLKEKLILWIIKLFNK